MTDRTFIGTLIEPRQALRARAALPAAGAWDAVPLEINVQGYSRMTLFGDYEQGAALGSCDMAIQWSPYQNANVPLGGVEWYPLTAIEIQELTAGTEHINEIQETILRFDPSAAGQNGLSIDLSLPQSAERIRVPCREVGVIATPGTLGLSVLLSPLEGGLRWPLVRSRSGADAELEALSHAEDSVHTSGHMGLMPLVVRQDTLAVLAANGDYLPLVVDATGRLYVNSMSAPYPDTTVDVIIANGQSLSAEGDAGAGMIVKGFRMPAAWTAASLTFQVGATGALQNFYDDFGVEMQVVAAVATNIGISNLHPWFGKRYFKIRSGTAGVPVAQGAARTITVIVGLP